jgi:hypothetical protein
MRLAATLLIIMLMLLGCNLTARQPTTPTPPPTALLITTLPPASNPAIPAEPINPDCPVTPFDWITYTIEPGDSLSLLAEQTTSTVDELVAGNCLNNADEIYVGQVIYLPRQPVVSP